MSLSGAKFPEVWEFGGSKKPGVSKKPKKTKKNNKTKKIKKTQYFKTLSAEAPSAKTSGKLFFCFFFFVLLFLFFVFLFFWKPHVFWNHQIPKPLENCIFWYF